MVDNERDTPANSEGDRPIQTTASPDRSTPAQYSNAPPPHPLDNSWNLSMDGATYGPYTGHQMADYVKEGRVGKSSRVARVGSDEWIKARDDPNLASLFEEPAVKPGVSSSGGGAAVQINQTFAAGSGFEDELGPKSPGIALVLSLLICGVGQMYNGKVAKGILMLVGFILLWVIWLGWVIWIWSMIDAYQEAKAINARYRRQMARSAASST